MTLKIHISNHDYHEHANIPRFKFIPVNSGYIQSGTPGEFGWYGGIKGAPNLNEPFIHFTFKVPDNFLSFLSIELIWITNESKTMAWKIQSKYGAKDELYNTHQELPSIGYTNSILNKLNVQAPTYPLTLPDLLSGDYISIQLERWGTNTGDTLTNDVYLLGLLFHYTAKE